MSLEQGVWGYGHRSESSAGGCGCKCLRKKHVTNIRAAGSDEALRLTPARCHPWRIEFIDDDELVEVTPKDIRIRKNLKH